LSHVSAISKERKGKKRREGKSVGSQKKKQKKKEYQNPS
jgi:hypothetical protein